MSFFHAVTRFYHPNGDHGDARGRYSQLNYIPADRFVVPEGVNRGEVTKVVITKNVQLHDTLPQVFPRQSDDGTRLPAAMFDGHTLTVEALTLAAAIKRLVAIVSADHHKTSPEISPVDTRISTIMSYAAETVSRPISRGRLRLVYSDSHGRRNRGPDNAC